MLREADPVAKVAKLSLATVLMLAANRRVAIYV